MIITITLNCSITEIHIYIYSEYLHPLYCASSDKAAVPCDAELATAGEDSSPHGCCPESKDIGAGTSKYF